MRLTSAKAELRAAAPPDAAALFASGSRRVAPD